MRKWRNLISAALCISMLFCFSSTVSASSIMEKITDEETTAPFAEDREYSLLRGTNLNFGDIKITRLSSSEINIYGLTQCHHECKTVYLDLYLEQKDDGSYYTYKTWRFEDSDVSNLEKSINVKVPSGHYYRVTGYHAAKDGGIKESTSTLTQGIWVGN